MKNGEKYHRSWLVYSEKKDSIYCFACKMFSALDCNLATNGCKDWQHVGSILSKHEVSSKHLESMLMMKQMVMAEKKGQKLSDLMACQYTIEVQYWRNVLHRILSIIFFLAQHNIALRGTAGHEIIGDPKNGPFLGLVELLAKYDPIMEEHIKKIKNGETHDHYLGKNIQNELIELAGKKILSRICESVAQAKYFAIILDCTPDVNHLEQMSFVIRYVDVQSNPARVEEHFVGFINVSSTTSQHLTKVILETLENLGLSLDNCRGQGYDNGANMAGKQSGVQKRILDLNPYAMFMPCGCHSLNLILCDSAKSCVVFFTYFGVLQKIYSLFSHSTKRWEVLKAYCQKVVKRPADTRWESKINSVMTVRFEYEGVVNSLSDLRKQASDSLVVAEIKGILKEVLSFEFVLSTVIWYDVLAKANLVSKYLQSQEMKIDEAVAQVQGLKQWMMHYRDNGFKQAVEIAFDIAKSCSADAGVTLQFKPVRRKRHANETTSSSTWILDPQTKYEVEVFNVMLDTFVSSISERFKQMETYNNHFGFLLNIANISPEYSEQIGEKCDKVAELLGADIERNALKVEIESISRVSTTAKNCTEFLNYLITSGLVECYPNLYIALRIILTTPVTVATGERSFSKLKLIKTHLRSPMGQSRLNGLSMMSIEHKLARNTDFDDLIDTFAHAKIRKKLFL